MLARDRCVIVCSRILVVKTKTVFKNNRCRGKKMLSWTSRSLMEAVARLDAERDAELIANLVRISSNVEGGVDPPYRCPFTEGMLNELEINVSMPGHTYLVITRCGSIVP